MKFYKPQRYKTIGFIISMPFITLVLVHILYDDRLFKEWQIMAVSYPIIYLIGVISWYLHAQYEAYVYRKFPELNQTHKRVLYLLPLNLMIMTPSVLVIFYVYDYFNILGYKIQEGDLKWGLVAGFCVNIIFESLWEVIYIIDKYKESLSEKELVEKMKIQQEFENLKSQVNPHFLFNCFNALSSLITEDKKQAEAFLDELSKVYRYLLRNNEAGMATLESEIRFIESYYRLLKTRYGQALQLHMEIDKKYYPYELPSLSLQLLVENAVKHNVVSRQQPLMIEVFTTSGSQLVVNNNLQQKQQKEKSTRIGLNNIRGKYKLLQQEGFQVVEGEKNFMVVLPLIWNHQSPQKPMGHGMDAIIEK